MIGNKGSRSKSFTLIELLVVISIIGLLSAIVIVGFNSAKANARDAKRASDMDQINKALQMYYNDNGSFPDPCDGCCDTCSGAWSKLFLTPSYISLPIDPLGQTGACDTQVPNYYAYCRNQVFFPAGHPCEDKLVLFARFETDNHPGLRDDCQYPAAYGSRDYLRIVGE